MEKQRLPAELSDHIMQLLSDDTQALKNCSLTCNRWRFFAYRYLLRFIHITSASQYRDFEQLLARHPQLAGCVQRFALTKAGDKGTLPLMVRANSMDCTWPRLVGQLHGVTELVITRWNATRARPDILRDMHTFFPSVTTVRVADSAFSGYELLRLLAACPRLCNLYLRYVECGEMKLLQDDQAALGALPPGIVRAAADETLSIEKISLRNLNSITSSNAGELCGWLARGPFKVRLRALELEGHTTWSILDALSALRQSIRTLEHLVLSLVICRVSLTASLQTFAQFWIQDICRDPHSSRLSVLHLKSTFLGDGVWNCASSLRWMTAILDPVIGFDRIPPLKHLVISIRLLEILHYDRTIIKFQELARLESIFKQLAVRLPGLGIRLNLFDETRSSAEWEHLVISVFDYFYFQRGLGNFECEFVVAGGHEWHSDRPFGGSLKADCVRPLE